MIDDGGPAFPARIPLIHNDEQGKDYPSYDDTGMSLRDYFAGQAMAAYLSSPTTCRVLTDHAGQCAKRAYIQADAMLAARKAQP